MKTELTSWDVEQLDLLAHGNKNPGEITETCKTCKHRQRWQCNSKVFQYNGLGL